MGFLDNLENNLKSMESAEQNREGAEREKSRAASRAEALAAAPWAERLKSSPFTAELLRQAARVGFSLRTKVYVAWMGTSLKLEARERRLELRPTPQGVVAVYSRNGVEERTAPLDLAGDAAEFVRAWLAG